MPMIPRQRNHIYLLKLSIWIWERYVTDNLGKVKTDFVHSRDGQMSNQAF